MLSIERIKELMKQPNMPDDEAKLLREGLYDLAQIIFEKWRIDKKKPLNKDYNADFSEAEAKEN